MDSNLKLSRYSWILYDFANSFFFLNIASVYFILWLSVEKKCPDLYCALTMASSIILASVLMPTIGEMSDRLKMRTPFLIIFTLGCIIFTALLGLVQSVFLALVLFFLAYFCYQLSVVVYNVLLVQVSTRQTLGKTSGLGVSFGYLGIVLGLHLLKPVFTAKGPQATFIPTAALFLFFAIPALILINDLPHPYLPKIELKRKTSFLRSLKSLSQINASQNLSRFFITAFLSLSAINTFILSMGIYAKKVIGLGAAEIIYFISIAILFAIVGSYASGYLVDRRGSKLTLNLIFKLWCLVIFLSCILTARWMFWLIAPLAGISLGATWVSLRTMLIELAPSERVGQLFGLLGSTERLSFVIGPLIWGLIVDGVFAGLAGFKYRLAMVAVFILMFTASLLFRTWPTSIETADISND